MSQFIKAINTLLCRGVKLPNGPTFDKTYLSGKRPTSLTSIFRRVINCFIRAGNLNQTHVKILTDLKMERPLYFLYVHTKKHHIKHKLHTTSDVPDYIRTLFQKETLRDLLLADGETFYDRAKNLLHDKKININADHQTEIEEIFNRIIHMEYTLLFIPNHYTQFEYKNELKIEDEISFLYGAFNACFYRVFLRQQIEYCFRISLPIYGMSGFIALENLGENQEEIQEEPDLRLS